MRLRTLSRRTLLAAPASLLAARAFGQRRLPRPGCQTNAWNLDPKRFDLLLTALREIKELNFEGFETNIRFLQPQLERWPQAHAAIESTGLQCIGVHTGLPRYENAGMEKAGAEVAKLAAQAKTFGAAALVCSSRGLSPSGQFPASALEEKARFLDVAGRRCAEAGVTLAYHNHEPEFRNGSAEMSGLLEKTDPKMVFSMLDIGHAWRADPTAVSFFEKHQARVFGLHVRDYHDGVFRSPRPGRVSAACAGESHRRDGLARLAH